jgi:hypothetical protein
MEAIQLLVHHASAVVAAIIIFALVARLAIWLLPHGFVRKVVVVIDDFVLIGLLLYFGYEMFVYLWNRKPPLHGAAAARAALRGAAAGMPPSVAQALARVADMIGRFAALP